MKWNMQQNWDTIHIKQLGWVVDIASRRLALGLQQCAFVHTRHSTWHAIHMLAYIDISPYLYTY
eukprot:11586485-Ditylum_brightwellii.AAC.1